MLVFEEFILYFAHYLLSSFKDIPKVFSMSVNDYFLLEIYALVYFFHFFLYPSLGAYSRYLELSRYELFKRYTLKLDTSNLSNL